MVPQQIQWGTTTILLDQSTFRRGYQNGRETYFLHNDNKGTSQQADETLNCREIIGFFLCGGTDHTPFHFHGEQIIAPIETLGEIIGYMSGPLYPETPEEQRARFAEWGEVRGPASVSSR